MPWDATTEVRQNTALIKDKIDQEVQAGFLFTAIGHEYVCRAVDQKFDFPDIGEEALGKLHMGAEGLKREYMTGEAYFYKDHLARPDDLCLNAALMTSLFPQLRSGSQ